MESVNRIDMAVSFHKSGYNCGQAVFCAFSDIFGTDLSFAFSLSQALGRGVGGLHEICGAVNAMGLVVGLLAGNVAVDKVAQSQVYAITRQLAEEFRLANGAIVCRQLLGLETVNGAHIKKKPCVEYVAKCAELLQGYVAKMETGMAKS